MGKYGEDCDRACVVRGLLGVNKSNMKRQKSFVHGERIVLEGSRLGEECSSDRVSIRLEWTGSCKGKSQCKKTSIEG